MQCEDSAIVMGDCQGRPDQPTDWDLCLMTCQLWTVPSSLLVSSWCL